MKIFLLCGVPGSGKSTWARDPANIARYYQIVSRDEIRFSLLEEGEDYFAKEKKVFKIFCQKIQAAINNKFNEAVVIDATHIDSRSRAKVLRQITIPNGAELIAVDFRVPLDECLARNRKRIGLRRVPDDVVVNAFNKFEHPHSGELFEYDRIIEVIN